MPIPMMMNNEANQKAQVAQNLFNCVVAFYQTTDEQGNNVETKVLDETDRETLMTIINKLV